jgi:hypothetical protein
MCARMIAFYIVGMSMKTSRNALFMESTDSIVEKMMVMRRNATEERAGLNRWFGCASEIGRLMATPAGRRCECKLWRGGGSTSDKVQLLGLWYTIFGED